MKTAFFFLIFVSSTLAFAVTTSLTASAPATKKQVKVAADILKEALDLEEGSQKYLEKIKKAKKFLQNREVQVSFKAQIFCGKEQILSWDAGNDCSYAGSNRLCYKARSKKEAVKLLAAIIERDFLNWDEEWVENPRLIGQEILVDYVDGPNELREEATVSACK